MLNFQYRFKKSVILRSIQILPYGDRRKIIAVSFFQICLGVLDLLGVLVIGLLGAVAVTGVESIQSEGQVESLLQKVRISEHPFQTQALILAASAILLLGSRTLLSILFTRRALFFLCKRGAAISANLTSRLLSQPLLTVQARTVHETLYSITRGVEYMTVQVLATSIILLADVSLLFILGVGLFFVDPLTATGTFVFFAAIGVFLYWILHMRAGSLGVDYSRLNIESNERITEVLASYRESVVRNRRDFYSREIGKIRFELADTFAEMSFMPYIGKYVIETAVVIGGLLLGITQFFLRDTVSAVSTLAIFLAAGMRIAPAVLRVQQGAIQIRGSAGMANPALDLIDALKNASPLEHVDDSLDLSHNGFVPNVHINGLTVKYPGKRDSAITNINLIIPAGSSVAIVGRSGAGKTTLIDALLGILHSDEGNVTISGLSPLDASAKWPGAISYVPQDVMISNGSIRENVALGFPLDLAQDDLVMSALKTANLDGWVRELPEGLDTLVGERGAKISGGQRQRLGIARAMFTKPKLLVLDEATSSLDGETENSIAAAIQNLRGSVTVVTIAHRLSTVEKSEIVVYMAAGKVVACGNFGELRKIVPDFDNQAKLTGISSP